MANTQCICLYNALCLGKEKFNREQAKDNYKMLISQADSLDTETKNKVVNLLELAKNTLGNPGLEDIYSRDGDLGEEHSCANTRDILRIIHDLYKEDTTAHYTSNDTLPTCEDDPIIRVESIIDHRFRKDKLKFITLTQPGRFRITEDEDKILAAAKPELIEYLKHLKHAKPRRLGHIIRRRPQFIKLLLASP